MRMRVLFWSAAMFCASLTIEAQQASTRKNCAVVREPASAAELELASDAAKAEELFLAMPASSVATAGVIRAKLMQRQFDEALILALREDAAHPGDPTLLNALAEVRYRRGEVVEASALLNRSSALDPCNGRTHYDVSRFKQLNGDYATSLKELNFAHALSPNDPDIQRAWKRNQRERITPAEEVTLLQKRAAASDLKDDEKQRLQDQIAAQQSIAQGNCRLVEPASATKIPLLTMGNAVSQEGSSASGLEISFNGKRRHLALDTGASGLSLTKSAAAALGLTPQASVKTRGFGDEDGSSGYLTHVDSIRVGSMQFQNCLVDVIDAGDRLSGIDGLVGPDVFRAFLVTIDFPADEMRLSPLPRRPGDASEVASLDTEKDEVSGPPQDRYIAPEMKDWFPVFRSGHFIIVPTFIGKGISKLFIMDTGSSSNLISPEAAAEVSRVTGGAAGEFIGLSGKSKSISNGGEVLLKFANIRQQTESIRAIKLPEFVNEVEISGFLGYEALRHLKLEIDYRDNLMRFTYAPHIDKAARPLM